MEERDWETDQPRPKKQRIPDGTWLVMSGSQYQIAGQAIHFSLVLEYPVEYTKIHGYVHSSTYKTICFELIHAKLESIISMS